MITDPFTHYEYVAHGMIEYPMHIHHSDRGPTCVSMQYKVRTTSAACILHHGKREVHADHGVMKMHVEE